MNNEFELTEDEKQLILTRRAEKAKEEKEKKQIIMIYEIAFIYRVYLEKENLEDSYSVFYDYVNHANIDWFGINVKRIYELINNLHLNVELYVSSGWVCPSLEKKTWNY